MNVEQLEALLGKEFLKDDRPLLEMLLEEGEEATSNKRDDLMHAIEHAITRAVWEVDLSHDNPEENEEDKEATRMMIIREIQSLIALARLVDTINPREPKNPPLS